jgi:hypothetical protein
MRTLMQIWKPVTVTAMLFTFACGRGDEHQSSDLAEISVAFPDSAEGTYSKATLSYERVINGQPGVTKQVILTSQQLKSDLLIPSGTYNFSVTYEGKDKAGAELVAKTIPGNKYCDIVRADVKPARTNSLVLPVCEGSDIRDASEFNNSDSDVAASVKVSSDISYSGDKNVIECWRYGTKKSGSSYIGSFIVNSVKEGGYEVYIQVQTGNEDSWKYKFYKISKATFTKKSMASVASCNGYSNRFEGKHWIKMDAPAVSIESDSFYEGCYTSEYSVAAANWNYKPNFTLTINGEQYRWEACRVRNLP